jgi:hypothetical protein
MSKNVQLSTRTPPQKAPESSDEPWRQVRRLAPRRARLGACWASVSKVAAKARRRTYTTEYQAAHSERRRTPSRRRERSGRCCGARACYSDPRNGKISELERQLAEMTGRPDGPRPWCTPKTWRRCSAGRGRPRGHDRADGGAPRPRRHRPAVRGPNRDDGAAPRHPLAPLPRAAPPPRSARAAVASAHPTRGPS